MTPLLRIAAWLLLACHVPAFAQLGFYRFPSLQGEQVWFTAEGDLWRVGTQGGVAQRITTHPGLETRGEPSPDGRWLAFVGAYEGPTEAYVMPVAGGVPKRLTWDGQGVAVWGWTPAGEVLITAPSLTGQPDRQLYAIDPATLARRALPAAQASDGAVSADGRTLWFTRSGLASDNVRAYRGGAMSRIWSLDLSGKAEARPLLDAGANTRRPMPWRSARGARLAFLSDRDGRFNLWSTDLDGNDLRQHTRHVEADIRHAGIHGTRVVYAIGADLHVIDLETDADRPLQITLGGDFDQQRTRWVKKAPSFLSATALSPDGERVAMTVRGHVATQGVGALRRAELAIPADARCRDVVFSRDSRHVFALCDIGGGEVEAFRFLANGSGTPVQLTRGATTLRLGLFPSPDGKWLAHGDLDGRLSLTALTATGAGTTQVFDESRHGATDSPIVWSPDSRALAFSRIDTAYEREQIVLHMLGTTPGTRGTTQLLTTDRYDSRSPSFTPDGKWLYFLSDRSFAVSNRGGPWGDRNTGPYFDRRTRAYALALQPGTRFPFRARDELDTSPPAARPAPVTATAVAGAASASVSVTPPAPPASAASGPRPGIVTAGLAERLFEVPLPAGNFERLVADDKRLYVFERDALPDKGNNLRTLTIDDSGASPELFAADLSDFELSPSGKKLLIVRRAGNDAGQMLIVDAAPRLPADTSKNEVRWMDWQIAIDPKAEWRQTFADAWRLHRDFLFDPTMRGADWAAVRRRYEPLVDRVTDRAELNELLSQMVGEAATLHSQVGTRDVREGTDDIATAGLGARTVKVDKGFRIERIYRTDPELPAEAGPLQSASMAGGAQRPAPGDVIVAVNGRPTTGVADLSELLRGQAGRQTLLTLQIESGAERQAIVLPVGAAREAQLRTGDWERGRLQRAAERSQGRVGYLRLRAMGPADIATFAREFYAQVDRDTLIIDVRNNNGGSIDSWVIEKLLRRAWAFWQPRAGAPPHPNMQQVFRGHLAVLINENTYSDGETFAEGIKRLQLGAVIGKRTSGAGVWLSDRNRLIDNGIMRAAQLAQFAMDGSWLIEGRGVSPDIEVDNPPRATFDGGDAQLDAAIDHLLKRLAEAPVPALKAGPFTPAGIVRAP